MAGRKPKPTALKIVTGNPGGRPLNQNEPKPDVGLPNIPEWLKVFPKAVENWNDEGGILAKIGVITEADAGTLAARSYIYSQLVELTADIQVEGRTLETKKLDRDGNEVLSSVIHNPKVKQVESLMKEYRMYGNLLGLDPSNRSKLSVSKSKESNPWESI